MKKDTIRVTRYLLTPAMTKSIQEKLQGKIGWRDLARKLGVGPQHAVNLTAGIAVQWVIDGKLVLTSGRSKGHEKK